MKVLCDGAVHVVAEAQAGTMRRSPVECARLLLSNRGSLSDAADISALIEPAITQLLVSQSRLWEHLPLRRYDYGVFPTDPRVSVVVPLYRRSDFVESQLMEFGRDPWFLEHAELIFVVDDPGLLAGFSACAEFLSRLYQVPFRVVWGSANRGFSGANNLGVSNSRGEYLLFLNSDAFPQGPGWLQQMVEVLASRSDVGVVGPRLVYADGSIQHAGMQFLWRSDLGIWINHHPLMGLSIDLDPHRELSLVPAVTGACMLLRRADFERVGGWDTGYLVGDFEDSDLCLRLAEQGLATAYLPSVQLVHLERQSFRLTGDDDFRVRVVIYNAVRHQQRWRAAIAHAAASPPP